MSKAVKYGLFTLVIGICLWVYATLQKILHASNAELFFKMATWVIILSLLFVAIQILFNKK